MDFGTGDDVNIGGVDLFGCATARLGYIEDAVVTADDPCPVAR